MPILKGDVHIIGRSRSAINTKPRSLECNLLLEYHYYFTISFKQREVKEKTLYGRNIKYHEKCPERRLGLPMIKVNTQS